MKCWEVLAYRAPGGHGGLLVSAEPGAVSGSLVIDVVAMKEHVVLCIEGKASASDADRLKLDQLFACTAARERLAVAVRQATIHSGMDAAMPLVIVKSLAYGRGQLQPDDFVVFHVTEQGVRAIVGGAVSADAASLFAVR